MSNLSLHAGGFVATMEEIEAVPVPASTRSFVPVPHVEVIDFAHEVAKLAGLEIKSERYGLARDGQKLFGLIETNGQDFGDHGFGIGVRSSYDKSLAIGLAIGTRVFVCDNLAFAADFLAFRKHTANVYAGLRDMVAEAAEKYVHNRDTEEKRIGTWRSTWIERGQVVDHLIMNCVRNGVLAPTDVPTIIKTVKDVPEKYQTMGNEEGRLSGWCFQNLITDITRGQSATMQWERTRKLGDMLDEMIEDGVIARAE